MPFNRQNLLGRPCVPRTSIGFPQLLHNTAYPRLMKQRPEPSTTLPTLEAS
jgi:hypothetical protein